MGVWSDSGVGVGLWGFLKSTENKTKYSSIQRRKGDKLGIGY